MLRMQQQQQLRQAAALKGLGGQAAGAAGAPGGMVGAGGGKLGAAPQPDRFGLLGLLSVIRMTGGPPLNSCCCCCFKFIGLSRLARAALAREAPACWQGRPEGRSGASSGGSSLALAFQPPSLTWRRSHSPPRFADPDLTTLALGTDLTTLGLNLNSTESLWKTFASPWADGPSKAEPEFKVG